MPKAVKVWSAGSWLNHAGCAARAGHHGRHRGAPGLARPCSCGLASRWSAIKGTARTLVGAEGAPTRGRVGALAAPGSEGWGRPRCGSTCCARQKAKQRVVAPKGASWWRRRRKRRVFKPILGAIRGHRGGAISQDRGAFSADSGPREGWSGGRQVAAGVRPGGRPPLRSTCCAPEAQTRDRAFHPSLLCSPEPVNVPAPFRRAYEGGI